MSDAVTAPRTRPRPKKRRHWVWWAVLAVLVIVVLVIVLQMLNGGGSTTSAVTSAQVSRQTLQATVSGSGNAVVSGVTEIQPGISGTVKDLSVKLGQSVKAGEQLFSISNPSLDTAVERDEASYDSARQQVKSARASLTQARNTLYTTQHPGNAASKPLQSAVYVRAVKLAKQQVCVAEAGLSAAEEGLDSASQSLSVDKDNADQRTVTAPVSGVITALNAANGVALSGGSSSSSSGSSSSGSASAASVSSSANSAVEIADLSTLKAQIQINEVDLVNVKVGQSASVTFDALPSDPVSGTVTAVAPTGVNSSGVVSYNVDITLASVDKRLRPTMSCSADINTATHTDALVVPSTAVHTNATTQSHYVVVLASDGSQRQVTVKTGLIVGTQTEILSGLQAGQDVVTSSSSTTSGSTATSSSTATSGSSGANRGGGGIGALLGR